jgi:hypothetical protein
LLLISWAFGEDVIHLLTYGAVVEICGQEAIDEGPELFLMVLLIEFTSIKRVYKICNSVNIVIETINDFANLENNIH